MKNDKTMNLVLAALMTCLVCVATMFIRIPIPFTQGYVHLGDSMVFLSVMVLGGRIGAGAAGVGSMLADLLSGYAAWAPWTLAIKFIMALIMGISVASAKKKGLYKKDGKNLPILLIAMIIAGFVMCFGYYISAVIMYGSFYTPLLSVPWNIGQFAVGIVLANIIALALSTTPASKYFSIWYNDKDKESLRA